MKKNDKKNTPSENKEEFEHFTKVLMEKMDSTVKTVTEQYGSLIKKIDNIGSDVVDLKEDMSIVKPAVEMHGKDLKEIKSELHYVKMAVMDVSREMKDHEKRIKRVEEKVIV